MVPNVGGRPNRASGFVRHRGVQALEQLEPIYRAEFDNLVRALTLLAGSRETAADAVQEAFVAASLRWRDVDVTNPAGWIRTVAARRLLDGRRRGERWQRLVPALRASGRPVASAEDLAGDSSLLAVVARLPARQRAAVVLHYLADWSVDDVAAALRVSPGTVKSALYDARSALRAQLHGGAIDA